MIFFFKILNFLRLLKLNIAYNEKTIEKKFNAKGPNIIKIGNRNINNCKIKLILLVSLTSII